MNCPTWLERGAAASPLGLAHAAVSPTVRVCPVPSAAKSRHYLPLPDAVHRFGANFLAQVAAQ